MEVAFFSTPNLKVGDLATGFPTDDTLAALLALPKDISEEELRNVCRGLHILLYEIIEVVNRLGWFGRVHYCKVCRCSDGQVLKIKLSEPPFEWPYADKGPSPDPRSDWLRLHVAVAT